MFNPQKSGTRTPAAPTTQSLLLHDAFAKLQRKSETAASAYGILRFINRRKLWFNLCKACKIIPPGFAASFVEELVSYREKNLENLEIQEGACTFAPQTLNILNGFPRSLFNKNKG